MHVQSSSSLRRAYLEWIEEQIEEYKDSIPRSELLRLAEQVVAELQVNRRGQYQLTELLLCEEVDRTIFRLLRLPGFRGWSARYLEAMQREAARATEVKEREVETPAVSL